LATFRLHAMRNNEKTTRLFGSQQERSSSERLGASPMSTVFRTFAHAAMQ
jgi:hypothetical protein